MFLVLSLSVFAQVAITPNNPTDNDDLICNLQTGTPSMYIYKWFLNNEEKSNGNRLPNSVTNPSETWMCRVYVPPTRYTGITLLGEASVTVTSVATNSPPYFASTPLTTWTVGVLYTYDANAADPEGNTLIYSLIAPLPAGMVINSTTGIVLWTPSSTGTYPITIAVNDGNSAATQSYNLIITALPVINSSTEMPDYLPIPPKP